MYSKYTETLMINNLKRHQVQQYWQATAHSEVYAVQKCEHIFLPILPEATLTIQQK